MYRKILSEPLHFPGPEIVPPAAKDLLTQLLDRRPEHRLGAKGASEIKAHPFFNSIDWRKLLQRKYDPTFKPNVVSFPRLTTADISIIQLEADYHRWTRWTRQTLTVNLPKRRQQIRMWTDLYSRKPCNSNLQAGPTIARWPGSETQEEVSKTLHLEALHDGMDARDFNGLRSRLYVRLQKAAAALPMKMASNTLYATRSVKYNIDSFVPLLGCNGRRLYVTH